MCGIFGSFGNLSDCDPSILSELNHRGPDQRGWIHLNGGVLGHTRLSIIDLSHLSKQPMSIDFGNLTIVFNGEIYNYQELKNDLIKKGCKFNTNSDTEVIITGYKEYGQDFFSKLEGMFAFAIYDNSKSELILVRDEFGIKPIMYYSTGNDITFCSELLPLIRTKKNYFNLNSSSLFNLFKYGSINQPDTIVDNVFYVKPGHILTWKKGIALSEKRFSKTIEYKNSFVGNFNDAKDEIRRLTINCVKKSLVADVDLGIFLSGGHDSTILLSIISNYSSVKKTAFNISMKGYNEVTDESSLARSISKKFNTELVSIDLSTINIKDKFISFVKAIDQPSIDGFNQYILSSVVSKYVKVALSGLGADEVFGGYPQYRRILIANAKKQTFLDNLYYKIQLHKPNRYTIDRALIGRTPIESLSIFRTIYSDFELSAILNPDFIKDNQQYRTNNSKNIYVYEIENYLVNTLLRDTDVLSMANSLEVRPPFLDRNLVDFSMTLPQEYFINGTISKYIFKQAFKAELQDINFNTIKSGFELPFNNWMKNELQGIFIELLEDQLFENIFKKQFLSHTLQKLKKGTLRRRDWVILVFMSWYKSNYNICR